MKRMTRPTTAALFPSVLRSVALLLLICVGLPSAHASSQYFYDRLGRLTSVINSDGSTIEYHYDSNGNVTSINRVAAQTLSVGWFSPIATRVGLNVTIYGTGFDVTPANNLVKIGGVSAPVSSATSSALTISVPPNAATGLVSVTVAGVTAISSQSLTVLGPTINSFSPVVVNPGTAVTVLGGNLNLVPGSTSISVGSNAVSIGSLSNSQATFSAPTNSGYITVNTSYGLVTSAAMLTVIPAVIPSANVASMSTLVTGGASQTLNVDQPNKYGVFQFDATQAQNINIQISPLITNPSGSSVGYQVYSPSSTVIASGYVSATNTSIYLPAIAATGTYLVSFTSTATFQLTATLGVNSGPSVDGAPYVVSTSPGQTVRSDFNATAGDKMGLGISNIVRTNGSGSYNYVLVNVFKPDGTTLVSNSICYVANGCDFNLNIPTTGVYGFVVQSPNLSNEPNLSLSYSATVTHDLVAPLAANAPTPVSMRNGQNGRFTFTATAGVSFGFQIGGLSSTPSGRQMSYVIYKPDGTTLSAYAIASGMTFEWNSMPVTGTYTLFIDPQYGAVTNITVMAVPSGTATVTTDGASRAINNNAVPGAFNYFTFSANAGDNIGIGISNIAVQNNPSFSWAGIYVRKPDGTQLLNPSCTYSTGCDINLTNLPMTGTYSVVMQSPNPANEPRLQISFTATVSHDLVTPLTANTLAPVSLRSGQNGRFTFAANAGSGFAFEIGGLSAMPSGKQISYVIYKPDGTTFTSYAIASGITFTVPVPVTGTYTLYIDPQYGAPTNVTVMAVPASSVAVSLDGASGSISNDAIPGAFNYFTFSASAGDNISISISNVAVSNNPSFDWAGIYVLKPDGSQLLNPHCTYSSGCDITLTNLPATGTYSVIMQSPNPANEPRLQIGFLATLSHDLVVPLAASVPASVSLRRGQNGRFTFAATAGTGFAFQIGGLSTTPPGQQLNYVVYKPDGTTLTSYSIASGMTFLVAAPVTGTYTLYIDPQSGAPANVTVMAVSGSGAAVAIDGGNFSSTNSAVPGAFNYFTFSATAGDNFDIGIKNLVKTNGSSSYSNVAITFVKPDGSGLGSVTYCTISTDGCDYNFTNLPQTGMYSAIVQSPYPQAEPNVTLNFNATVSHDRVVPLTANTPTPVSLQRNENGRFTFAATAGSGFAFQIGGLSTTPSGQQLNYVLYKPDGTTLTSYSIVSGVTFMVPVPVTGTYTLYIDPQSGAAANVTVIAVTSSGAAVSVDGASFSSTNSVVPGAFNYFTFSANAGDNIGIGIKDLVKANGSSGYSNVAVTFVKPDGSAFGNVTYCTISTGCDYNFTNLPQTGVYSAIVQSPYPQAEPNMTLSFTATVSHDFVTPLTASTPASVNLHHGQNGRFTFAATAGNGFTFQIGGLSTTPSGQQMNYAIYKPDGTTLTTYSIASGVTFTLAVPVTGTYTLYIDPQYGAPTNVTVMAVPSSGAAVAVDGASVSSTNSAVPGAFNYFTFSATAGDNIGIGIKDLLKTNGSSGYTNVAVTFLKPDGGGLGTVTSCTISTGCDYNFPNLPQTGVYSAIVQSPYPQAEPNVTLSFTATVSHDLVVPLTAGTAAGITLDRNGQNARLTFSGTAGATASIQISGVTTTPSGRSINLTVYKPDGTSLSSVTTSSSYIFNLTNLPATGTYSLFVDPQGGVTAVLQATRQ